MRLHLCAQQENQILEVLRAGIYQSPGEVIDRALELLREQGEWLSVHHNAVNAKIHRAIAELDRGEGVSEDRTRRAARIPKNQSA